MFRLLPKIFIAACFTCLAGLFCLSSAATGDGRAMVSSSPVCAVKPLMNNEFYPVLLQAVDEAQKEIFIAVFSFKAGVHPRSYPDVLVEHMGMAVRRGVQVKVILEDSGNCNDSLSRQNFKTKALLEEKGVIVYLDSPVKTTHTKLVVVDERLVFIGSHNFTSSAFRHNNEISVLIDKPDLARNVRNYLLKIIKDAK